MDTCARCAAEIVMRECLFCRTPMQAFCRDIEDWEYGVEIDSELVICASCGLVTHEPAIRAEHIPALYPSNYLAHTPASKSTGTYGRLKELLARQAASRIAANVPDGGVFLEVGCGNGHLMESIAALRPDMQFVGVDIEHLEITRVPNFRFLHGQLEEIDLAEESADLIYCSNLIEHAPDPTVFAAKCARVLKPRGFLYGVTPDHLSLDRYLFGRYWAGYHYPRHTYLFNHNNILRLLDDAGFVDIRVRGAYSFWYLSLANRFMELPGTRPRGILFAAITACFLPIDLFINVFRCHGSMTFTARLPGDDIAPTE